jgi:hypothetical protein
LPEASSVVGLLGVVFMSIDPQEMRTIDPRDQNLCLTVQRDKRIFSLLGIEKSE